MIQRSGIKTSVITPAMLGYGEQHLSDGYAASNKDVVVNEADAYNRVPLVFRAVELRVDTLLRVPFYIYNDNDKVIEEGYIHEDQVPMRDWLRHAEASLLLKGYTFAVKLKNDVKADLGIQLLNPFTMTVEKDRDGKLVFKQSVNGQEYIQFGGNKSWTSDEMIYWREFNPADDYGAGTAAVNVCIEDARTLNYMKRFVSRFFEYGAMPITMLSLPEGLKAETGEREKVESFFKKAIGGIRNAFRVKAFIGDVKATKLTPDLDSLAMPEVRQDAIHNIAWSFKIPKTLLTADSANRSTADTEYYNFLTNTIGPRCNFYETNINRYLKQYNQRIEFAITELPEMQEDESRRATAFSYYTGGGMPAEVAVDVLGIDMSEDTRKVFDEAMKEKKAATIPGIPAEKITQASDASTSATGDATLQAELDKWKRKALRKMEIANKAYVPFESEIIPDDLRARVDAGLKGAASKEDIVKLFEGVR